MDRMLGFEPTEEQVPRSGASCKYDGIFGAVDGVNVKRLVKTREDGESLYQFRELYRRMSASARNYNMRYENKGRKIRVSKRGDSIYVELRGDE